MHDVFGEPQNAFLSPYEVSQTATHEDFQGVQGSCLLTHPAADAVRTATQVSVHDYRTPGSEPTSTTYEVAGSIHSDGRFHCDLSYPIAGEGVGMSLALELGFDGRTPWRDAQGAECGDAFLVTAESFPREFQNQTLAIRQAYIWATNVFRIPMFDGMVLTESNGPEAGQIVVSRTLGVREHVWQVWKE